MSCAPSPSPKPFPAPHDADTLGQFAVSPQEWRGRIAAFQGNVEAVSDIRGRAVYRIVIEGSAPLWVVFIHAGAPAAVARQTVKALGYLMSAKECDLVAVGAAPAEPALLSLAVINLATEKMTFAPEARAQLATWQEGHLPTAAP